MSENIKSLVPTTETIEAPKSETEVAKENIILCFTLIRNAPYSFDLNSKVHTALKFLDELHTKLDAPAADAPSTSTEA